MANKKLEALRSHEFSISVMNKGKETKSKLYDRKEAFKIDPAPKRDFTELEYYCLECAYRLANLYSLYEQILDIPAYLEEYSRTSCMRKRGINRLRYTLYHLENFIIRAKSSEDRILQLCAVVAHTGIDERNINFDIILKNMHIKAADISDILKKVHKVCDSYASHRNAIIHRHNLLDQELKDIELILLASRLDDEFKNIGQATYRKKIQNFVQQKIPELNKFISELLDTTVELFDKLIILYRDRSQLSH